MDLVRWASPNWEIGKESQRESVTAGFDPRFATCGEFSSATLWFFSGGDDSLLQSRVWSGERGASFKIVLLAVL